jgi:hypothetical protein
LFQRPTLAPYIAAKGSITVDGVSLTVNERDRRRSDGTQFTLNIIPHTWDVTTLADSLFVGRAVNLEIDVLARYLKRMEEADNKKGRPEGLLPPLRPGAKEWQPALLFRKFHIADIGAKPEPGPTRIGIRTMSPRRR